MNDILIRLQRMLKNKNTVTILGVLLAVIILYWGYNKQISDQVKPVRNIPVASETIQPRTKITRDMIKYVDIAQAVLSDNAIINANAVIGKYSNYNTLIPEGSLFYNNTIVDEKDLPDSAFTQVENGQVVYNFPVNMESTYGNSIFPGNRIDIYMKADNTNGQVMVGKLIENIKVLAVKDSQGRHVFENSDEARTPATLIFGVDPEINILLRKASYMKTQSVELFPVPHGGTATAEEEGTTQVSTEYLRDFINANTVVITQKETTKKTTDNNTQTSDSSTSTDKKTNNNSTNNATGAN